MAREVKSFVVRSRSAVIAMLIGVASVVTPLAATHASATEPSHVTQTVTGCRNDGSITFGLNGPFICPDAAYTGGNLGKGWNELDLVPWRLTTSTTNAAPATQTYTTGVAVDSFDAGHPGFDVLSTLTLNTTLSDASCVLVSVGAQTDITPGFGGIDKSLGRTVTITQAANTTCVFDYYARLALGSHLFPGSSLHGDLTDSSFSGEEQNVPLPVKEILPQELNKDMTATQGSDHVWNVVKGATPATLNFTNTCDASQPLSAGVAITVTWTKGPSVPSGAITVLTHVYATNPASRVITIQGNDVIKSGTTTIDTATFGPTDVPANTANFLLLTHSITVPAGTTNLNDIATATYTDKVTGVPVPGNTTATASATVQFTGPETNSSAVINDVESITGSNLSYSVDSFSGASGSFDNGYIAGTHTTGSVSWTSASQTASGHVTFNKTVYTTSATQTTGTLSDTATLTGSDGFTTTADLDVDLSAHATVSLGVSKDQDLSFLTAKVYTFHLWSGANDLGQSTTVTIPAGQLGPVDSALITGLTPGSYFFKEDATAPYKAQTTGTATFSLTPGDISTCTQRITVHNTSTPPKAQVKKDTLPASSGDWKFTLTGPGGLDEDLTVVAGSGYHQFLADLTVDGGTYTITETPQSNYDLTAITGDVDGTSARVTKDLAGLSCSFTLNLTTDSLAECGFTNTQQGSITVIKDAVPDSTQSFDYTTTGTGLSNFSLVDDGVHPALKSKTFSNLVPGSYSVTETLPVSHWDFNTLNCTSDLGTSTIGKTDATANITLAAGDHVTCTYTNTQRGTITIIKNAIPDDGQSFAYTTTGSGLSNFSLVDDGIDPTTKSKSFTDLVPGSYSVTETLPVTGWDFTSLNCTSDLGTSTIGKSTATANITLAAGDSVTCTYTNTKRGHVSVHKTVSGGAIPSGESFTFELCNGTALASNDPPCTSNSTNTIVVDSAHPTADFGLLPPGTYTLCELHLQPGWLSDLGTADPTTGNVCHTFTLAAGDLTTFNPINVDNTPPPGGGQRTIGYWKNWSSCKSSKGHQTPVLDQTLQLGDIVLGDLVLHDSNPDPNVASDCQAAVNILNKTTINGATKKASDPLFNMAAQLLGAKLNVAAGAGTCPAATNAINQASALLAKYHWNGLTYNGPLSAADKTLANNLNGTLDRYNNGLLCEA